MLFLRQLQEKALLSHSMRRGSFLLKLTKGKGRLSAPETETLEHMQLPSTESEPWSIEVNIVYWKWFPWTMLFHITYHLISFSGDSRDSI